MSVRRSLSGSIVYPRIIARRTDIALRGIDRRVERATAWLPSVSAANVKYPFEKGAKDEDQESHGNPGDRGHAALVQLLGPCAYGSRRRAAEGPADLPRRGQAGQGPCTRRGGSGLASRLRQGELAEPLPRDDRADEAWGQPC